MNNIFSNIPTLLADEHFDTLLETPGIKIERVISKGHTSPKTGWYDQPQNEWLIVLKGSAKLSFKDTADITLHTGDYYHLRAHELHKVSWTDPAVETIWLAIHY